MPDGTTRSKKFFSCFPRFSRKRHPSSETTGQPVAPSGVSQCLQRLPENLHSDGGASHTRVSPSDCTAGDTSSPPMKKEDAATAAAAAAVPIAVTAVPNPEAAASLAASLQSKMDETAYKVPPPALPAAEDKTSKSSAAKNAAALFGFGLVIIALRLYHFLTKTGSAVRRFIAAAATCVSSAAASVKSSRMALATKSLLQSSFASLIRHSQSAYMSACQLPLGAWLQMLCTLLWVVVISRQPQVNLNLNSMIACVSINTCIAIMASMSLVKLQSAATAAWSLITSISATAAACLTHCFSTISTFACSLAQRSLVLLTSSLAAARQCTPSFPLPMLSIDLLQLFDILQYGVYMVLGVCLSLVWAASLMLPRLVFDWLVAGLINSWPAGLVLLSWKVPHPSPNHCCKCRPFVVVPAWSCSTLQP